MSALGTHLPVGDHAPIPGMMADLHSSAMTAPKPWEGLTVDYVTPPSFCRLQSDILAIPEVELPYAQKCMYARLQLRVGTSGSYTGTMAALAKSLGCDPKNVTRHCDALQDFSRGGGRAAGVDFAYTKKGREFQFSVKPFDPTKKFVKLYLDMLQLPKHVMPFRSVCLFGYLEPFKDCFQSHRTIAAALGCSDRTIRDAFGPLKDLEMVKSIRRRRTSCRYLVCNEAARPKIVVECATECAAVARPVKAQDPETLKGETGAGGPVITEGCNGAEKRGEAPEGARMPPDLRDSAPIAGLEPVLESAACERNAYAFAFEALVAHHDVPQSVTTRHERDASAAQRRAINGSDTTQNGPVFRSTDGLIFRSETDQSSAYQKTLLRSSVLNDDADPDSLPAVDQKAIDAHGGFLPVRPQTKSSENIISIEEWGRGDRAGVVAMLMLRILHKLPKKERLLDVLCEAREMKIGDVVAAIELAYAKVRYTKNAPRSVSWFVSVLRNHREHQLRYSEPASVSGLGLMDSDEVDYLASAFDSTSDVARPTRMGVTGRQEGVPREALLN